jgi:hypothetical protein
VSVKPVLYDLNHKYGDVKLNKKKSVWRGGGKIGGKLNRTGTYAFLYVYEYLLIKY